jgi:hypothetical protein
MPLLGWLLFQQVHLYLFLVPTVLNAWSLILALRLWRQVQASRESIVAGIDAGPDSFSQDSA